MTLQERIQDKTKVPLSTRFVQWIKDVAIKNNQSEDFVFSLWQKYCIACTNYDQSPVQFEFLQWNKLADLN